MKDIVEYVKKTFNVKYCINGMRYWLQRNDFRYKKPHGVPAKADAQKQRAFHQTYANLKQTQGTDTIYFADSVHPCHQTRLAYAWIAKGARKAIATTARQHRLNLKGGICLSAQRLITHQCDKVDTETIQAFLKKLRQKHRSDEALQVIWDNVGYHHSKGVVAYAKALNIQLHYLPAYSPNLNPIERLWKIMHEQVTYNRYYETFSDFSSACLNFFKTIGRKKKLLRARITDNFQKIQLPHFAC